MTCALLWGALCLHPVSNDGVRLAELILLGATLLGALLLGWRYGWLRALLLLLYIAVTTFWLMPGRDNYDRLALREEAARAMRRYEGVPYRASGEGIYGIDGAGLLRRGAIDATFLYGLRTLNPALVRRAAEIWWGDGTPRELSPSGRSQARRITQIKAIHLFNDAILFPGDFALLNGKQPISYLGYHRWLLADADRGKVVLLEGKAIKPISVLATPVKVSAEGTPLDRPATLMRWRVLEPRRMERPRPF